MNISIDFGSLINQVQVGDLYFYSIMVRHDCLLRNEVMTKLTAFRAEYRKTQSLMKDAKNVAAVRDRLQRINSAFDSLNVLVHICSQG